MMSPARAGLSRGRLALDPRQGSPPVQPARCRRYGGHASACSAHTATVEEKCQYNTLLGRIYQEAGDVEGAEKAYQFVVANETREPQKRSAQFNLFRLYQKSGELENVIADLEKKTEKNPDDENALETLGYILNSVVRQPLKALSVYEKLSKLKPKDTSILNRLVYLYQTNKEYEKAGEGLPFRSLAFFDSNQNRLVLDDLKGINLV